MNVVIIEDDDVIIESLTLLFRMRWPEAKLVSSNLGDKGLELIVDWNPNLVILDLGLPDLDGLEVLKRIRLFSNVPVIILTVRGDEAEIVKGLEYGADDYITKPFKQLEFLARVKALTRRQEVPAIATCYQKGAFRLVSATHKLYLKDKEITLTHTEYLIFHKLLENANIVISHSTLSKMLWGEDYPDSIDAIRVYISRIRQKIHDDSSEPSIILTKPGLGYMLSA
ncbi:MAG: DNA-binding response regulator [Dehalococcoides mccartyi]|uniref:response regulator transcription factor n=1 Tax=Dehalococcoides mccartyi TaxID=61435 RepID=UPI00080524BF|nr:response regulator transcription factor [Dehalococcoides mccartyi]OBW62534.1 MAG: DNA-binding response regulator [Dehalococcoides mccartyi]